MGGRVVLGMLGAILVLACDPGVSTQVLVVFDASDSSKSRAEGLRVTVIGDGLDPVVQTQRLVGPGDHAVFPATQPLTPRDGDVTRRFTVVGELLDASEQVFQRQRAIAGFVEGQRREIRLWFDDTCDGLLSCSPVETCVDGSCVPACVSPTPVGASQGPTPQTTCAQHSKSITLPAAPTDLTDFPLFVAIDDDADLRELASPDGSDIGFRDPTSSSMLDHELVSYEDGSLRAWVRIPSIAGSARTRIDMLFGGSAHAQDSEGVWVGYRGVWHLDDSGRDASVLQNHAAEGAVLGYGPSPLGGAYSIGNQSLLIDDPAAGTLDFEVDESFGLSVWVAVDETVRPDGRIFYKGGTSAGRVGYVLTASDGQLRGKISDGSQVFETGDSPMPQGRWVHVAMILDREETDLRLYIDGEPTRVHPDVAGVDFFQNSRKAVIGGEPSCCRFEGQVDEVMLWEGRRSNDRIAFEYANQSAGASFLEIGPLETVN